MTQTDIKYFQEYKKLGGEKTEQEYYKILDIFFDETLDIFVYGDTIKHQSREKAIKTTIQKAKITNKEFNLIFASVDNIAAYT